MGKQGCSEKSNSGASFDSCLCPLASKFITTKLVLMTFTTSTNCGWKILIETFFLGTAKAHLRIETRHQLQNTSGLVKMFRRRREQALLTSHEKRCLLSAEIEVPDGRRRAKLGEGREPVLVADLLEVELGQRLRYLAGLVEAREGLVVPAADVLQRLDDHALPRVRLHLLFLELRLLLAPRQVLVLLADAFLFEQERVGSGQRRDDPTEEKFVQVPVESLVRRRIRQIELDSYQNTYKYS